MTDSSPWQSPAGSVSPPASPPAPYGPLASGAPGSASGGSGWTPPPKPGLIPLHPLTLGTLLAASFQVLRRNPRPTFGFALILIGGVSIFALAVVGVVGYFTFARTMNATGADAEALQAGSVAAVVLSSLVPLALSIVASAMLQGIISLEVARGTLGEKLKLAGLWRQAKGRLGALVGWTLLLSAAVLVAVAAVAILIAVIVALGGAVGIAIGIIVGVLSAGGAVVLAFWLATRLSLVPSALMLERLSLRKAIARSWSLTTGYFWRTLGIELLVAFIVQTVGGILSFPLSVALGLASTLVNPNGDEAAQNATVAIAYALSIVTTVVFGSITAVVQSAAAALIYIDLRMRKEGLDLELSRFVEARHAGDPRVPDPYLAAPLTPTAAFPAQPASGSPWS